MTQKSKYPIILCAPHAQTAIKDHKIRNRLALSDYEIWKCSDPYTGDLQEFTCAQYVHVATTHRLVCDFNRAPNIENAFHDFDFFGRPVFKKDQAFSESEKAEHIKKYWEPYHNDIADSIRNLDDEGHEIIFVIDYHNTSGDHPLTSQREYMPTLVVSNLGAFDTGKKNSRDAQITLPEEYMSELKATISDKLPLPVEINKIYKGGYNLVWLSKLKEQLGLKAKLYAIQLEYNLDLIYNPLTKHLDKDAKHKLEGGLNDAIVELYKNMSGE